MSEQAALIEELGFDPSALEGRTIKCGFVDGETVRGRDGAAPMAFPDGVTLTFTDGSEVSFRIAQYNPDEAEFRVSAALAASKEEQGDA